MDTYFLIYLIGIIISYIIFKLLLKDETHCWGMVFLKMLLSFMWLISIPIILLVCIGSIFNNLKPPKWL